MISRSIFVKRRIIFIPAIFFVFFPIIFRANRMYHLMYINVNTPRLGPILSPLSRPTWHVNLMFTSQSLAHRKYFCIDAMKNNIEIFLCIGSTDIEDLYIVLERDWKASHMMSSVVSPF